jgi:hypothetical protein
MPIAGGGAALHVLQRVGKFFVVKAAIFEVDFLRHNSTGLRRILPLRMEIEIDSALQFERPRESLAGFRQRRDELLVYRNIDARDLHPADRMPC